MKTRLALAFKKGISNMIIMNAEQKAINVIKETMSLVKYSINPYKLSNESSCSIDDILDSLRNYTTALKCLSSLHEFDINTFYHSINVCLLSVTLGCAFGLNQKQLIDLGISAIFHDIGKTFIPKEVLNKKAKLTDIEFEFMKTHVSKGYSYVKENVTIPNISFLGILHHHEKYDGTGYPIGIEGENIDIFGRIISIADVYDAITSDRPYRKALLHSYAADFIQHNSGTSFDPQIVNVFEGIIGSWT